MTHLGSWVGDGLNQGDTEAETDYVVSQYVRVKNILGMTYSTADTSQDTLQIHWRRVGAWFLDLRLTEMTAHWGREALNRGDSNRIISNDSVRVWKDRPMWVSNLTGKKYKQNKKAY